MSLSAANVIFNDAVRPLPAVEQLRLASIILDHLTHNPDAGAELAEEWYARERDAGFIESIARARKQVDEGKVVDHVMIKRELGLG